MLSSLAQNYQWQLNNFNIVGATNRSFLANDVGTYRVIITDNDGCIGISENINIGKNTPNTLTNIAPNPSNTGIFYMNYIENVPLPVRINIINTLGQVIKTQTFGSAPPHTIDLQKMPSGVYVIQGTIEGCENFNARIVVE
jgi:hypothetical protein